MSLLSFGENITIHVVAIGTQETEVRIESASRIFLNIINGGAKKRTFKASKSTSGTKCISFAAKRKSS